MHLHYMPFSRGLGSDLGGLGAAETLQNNPHNSAAQEPASSNRYQPDEVKIQGAVPKH